ncbi:hypothetical protein PM082_018500 [Marasmius tenuissimus]|nr:hypothetical protein PM082_018500 [Marasmius tenuissimus]
MPTLYKTVLSATLESGLIYPVALIIYAACVMGNIQAGDYDSLTRDLVSATVWDSLITIMGIASTLIIVRVSLGIAIYDKKSFKETVVREYEATREQPSTHSVVDIHRKDSEDTESTLETLDKDIEAQKSNRDTSLGQLILVVPRYWHAEPDTLTYTVTSTSIFRLMWSDGRSSP